ncbi:uncharacterized protein PFL1_02373 [Pseudozyma flocculosa PF-1]|uniref:Related to Maf-like protein C3G6.03c n=1 Tax=Pseudozyma flocculosa TaxID=84751 RepID=A0A5C3F6W9_9BASI|nr:uncharacterized protein PFL1_02373 [Pseudozyma flocculosa PF-1]EPQ30257.1 hypothetical protein PFL1_02373 [Pseudozyma flocculosa PF-1]SPO39806.1 related to Maf-like protein C3G6.03c [Pseudozyma flocculosa]
MTTRQESVSDFALSSPVFNKLAGKRVVLASASPRRKEILASVGIHPEIVPSTFKEDLPKAAFRGEGAFQYPVETGAKKALEVYERLVSENPEDPPDFVISADTVVIRDDEILEKPLDAQDNLRMLADLNGKTCQVVTGVTFIYPILQAPGYKARSLFETTTVQFADNPASLLKAYVESGEGLDRAGGFAIQGRASLLIKGIQGDFNNVVGFPLFSFHNFLHQLIEDDELEIEGEDL